MRSGSASPLSSSTPTMAVFPFPDSATERCCPPSPKVTVPGTSLPPCWFHTPPERVYTHAAPAPALSPAPPTKAVFPSADSATDVPCCTLRLLSPTAPVPTSLPPCWLHVPPERVNTHAAPALAL